MFEQLRKFVAEIKESAASASLDIATVPEAANGAGDLGSVPLELIGSYAGLAVVQVEPLGALGAEATGFIGMQIQKRLRAMQAGQGPLEPGELFAGQAAERERIMCERGMGEEQIQLLRNGIEGHAAAQGHNGWTVTVEGGKHASVQLFAQGTEDSPFDGLKSAEAFQRTRTGAQQLENSWAAEHVRELQGAPYESYYAPGKLASRGRTLDALAQGYVGGAHGNESLAALAALALRCVEGP